MYITETRFFLSMIFLAVVAAGIAAYIIRSRMVEYGRYRKMQQEFAEEKVRHVERERELIALSLHDDVKTVLTISLGKLKRLEPNTREHISLLGEVTNDINNVVDRLRNISSLLVPRAIGSRGPFYALQEFRNIYQQAGSFELRVEEAHCEDLPEERALLLYRILQEIYINALKHSGGTRLDVVADRVGNRLTVEAADNGKGFEMGIFTGSAGFGLKSLALQARMIGAKLYACSQPGEGTKYTIELNVNE